MSILFRIVFLVVAFTVFAVPAVAQNQNGVAHSGAGNGVAHAPANPSSGSFVFLSANYFIAQALATKHAIDAGAAIAVYNNASPVLKSRISQDEFVAREAQMMHEEYGRFGAVTISPPFWQSVRIQTLGTGGAAGAHGGAGALSGQFLSVILAAPLSKAWGREDLVTFHLDDDGHWRLSGFATSFVGAYRLAAPSAK